MAEHNPRQPLYVLRFAEGRYKDLYYNAEQRWKGVPREEAEAMSHKTALEMQNRLNQPAIRMATHLEPLHG